MKYLVSILILCIKTMSYGQHLNDPEKDSLKNVICNMEKMDQAIRKSPIKDTISTATFQAIDLQNFKMLEKIIIAYGFPDEKLLGRINCHAHGIMIHWSKGYPEWFNSKKTVTMFKREIDNGNLPLFVVDMAQFFYVSFMKDASDMTYWKLINEARLVYGLRTYNKAQFQKKEWIEPLKGNEKYPTHERLSNY